MTFATPYISSLSVLRYSALAAILASLACASALGHASRGGSGGARMEEKYGRLPISFEANRGQAEPQVQFLARGQGYSLFLSDLEAALALGSPTGPAKRDVVRMSLVGASKDAKAAGEDQLPGKANYFVGNDPAKWQPDVPTYGKVRYTCVYPGIDLVYHGNQRQLEYDFVVAPGARPETIRLNLDGAERLKLAGNGDLILRSATGELAFHKPSIYQEKGGRRRAIPGKFRLLGKSGVGFSVGGYDRSQPLVIDPILVYSTYLGGAGNVFGAEEGAPADLGYAVAVDADGSFYVAGTTWPTPYSYEQPFPTTSGAYQSPASQYNMVFVTKFNPAGTALIFSSVFGGTGHAVGGGYSYPYEYGGGDSALGIALDSANNVYLTGSTWSSDFPVTTGAFQTTNKASTGNYIGPEAFVTKLNASGSALMYSTYLGGSGDPEKFGNVGNAIAVDSSGNAYVAGYTGAQDFPVTKGAFQATAPDKSDLGQQGFVTKLNPAGTGLIYSTYLGGAGVSLIGTIFQRGVFLSGDVASAIAIDDAGNAYVAGSAFSKNFPVTTGAFQTVNRGVANQQPNGFLTKLNPAGTAEVFSTFLGGSGPALTPYYVYAPDSIHALAVDNLGNAYVAGETHSTDFPVTAGALTTTADGLGTGFVAKVNASGSGLEYSTFLGGDSASIVGLAVDALGNAYVAGTTDNDAFPETQDAIVGNIPVTQNQAGLAFVAKVNPTGTALPFATLLGGSQFYWNNWASALALDSAGNVYVTGSTQSSSFPTTSGAFQTKWYSSDGEEAEAFVSKLALSGETTDHFAAPITLTAPIHFTSLGPAVTLTATIVGGGSGPTPTGQATFFGPNLTTTVATLDGNGVAAWTPTLLNPGVYTAYASYAGDANHLTSAVPLAAPISFRAVGPPASILVLAGEPQETHKYGDTLSSIEVRVSDSTNYPVQGVTVSFTGAGLQFSPSPAITDAKGDVTVRPVALMPGSFTATASVLGTSKMDSWAITITPRPLTVAVHPTSRLYGAANPVFGNVLTGLVGSDVVTATDSTTATQSSPVGVYPLTVTLGGASLANYAVTVESKTYSVLPARLHLTVPSYKIVYGQAIPKLTYALTGFVNGETSGIVTGAPTLTLAATVASPAGTYPIQVSIGTLAAPNYTIAYYGLQPQLSIAKAPLTVKADNLTMHVGGAIPPLTYSFTGFVNSDTATNAVTGAPGISTTVTTHTHAGTYPIYTNVGTLKSGNYALTAVNGTITILP